ASSGSLCGDRKVTRAAACLEHRIAWTHDGVGGEAAPAPGEPGRDRVVHEVVDGRDPVEHRPYLRRGEDAGRHSCPHRFVSLFSISSWSRHLPTTNSIRSSMLWGAL